MVRIGTSPRYAIDIIGPDPISLEELRGGGPKSGKFKINEVFLTYE